MPACLSSLPRAATGGYCCKSLFGWRTKILRAADAFYAPRREGPYRFIQNRSRISVVALKSDAAAEKHKDQLSRDFLGCSIFDFCNNIGTKQTSRSSGPTSEFDPMRTSATVLVIWREQSRSEREIAIA